MNLRKFELYFGGAEVPTWRKLLAAEGVPHIALNYLHLRPRVSKRPWLLADHYPGDQKIFLLSGASGTKLWDQERHDQFFAAYLDFVQENLERITWFTEYDPDLGQDWVLRQREAWEGLADDKFVPVWHEDWSLQLLRQMVERHPNLGVPPVSQRTAGLLSSLVRRTRVNLHGLAFSHPYNESGGLYSTVVSGSWISPTRFGETVIWDHNRLRRYPAEEKEKIRRRYRQHFTQAGFDADKIQADVSGEVARYTIWAWLQLEASMAGPERVRLIRRPSSTQEEPEIVTNGYVHRLPETAPEPLEGVAISSGNGHDTASLLPVVLGEDLRPLPVFTYRPVATEVPGPDGQLVPAVSQVAVMNSAGLRRCDSCSLALLCPLYESGADCRYEIPVEIRTRDQLMSILNSLLEMQAQRVAFGFFTEQLNGAYPDANLSSELDRFMRMTQSVRDITDNRDFLKVSIEGRAQSGVLARLFGAERAETLRKVDSDRAEDAVRKTMR
jgi:hypothetical protein